MTNYLYGDNIKWSSSVEKKPRQLCQWLNCNYFAICKIQRGLNGAKVYVCIKHREIFRELKDERIHKLKWQARRQRYITNERIY